MMERFELVQRVEFIRAACAGKKVLHLGCTNFPYTRDSIANDMLLHSELAKTASELYGFDFDEEGLAILRESGVANLYQADLERLDEVPLDTTFDVIIAGEMIEHLSNPGLFLRGIRRFMNERTELVITTINAYCAMRFFIYGLRGKGGVNEPVHPDHIAYFSYRTLRLLVEREKLAVKRFAFYDIGHEHRPFNRPLLNFVNDVSVRISPHLSDGIIAVCGLGEAKDGV